LIFRKRHHDVLVRDHHPPGTPAFRARMRNKTRGQVLVIEDRVPYPSLGAGYPRSALMLQRLLAENWFVTLYPLVYPDDDEAERVMFPPQLEVIHGQGAVRLGAFLAARAGYYQQIIVCRPHNMRDFLKSGGRAFAPRLIYDAEAVFAERDIARLALEGKPLSEERADILRSEEMEMAGVADIVLAVSDAEARLFRAAGCKDVRVLGYALAPKMTSTPHADRRDLLFVGALDDDPSPNVDGLLWFVETVMKRLEQQIGTGWQLLVAGRAGARRVQALDGKRVRVLGRVADLTPLYAACRVFIAPMRFSGGIPLKVQEAVAYGLPVVTTSLLSGQLGWDHEAALLVADTPGDYANACARLYNDAALWTRLRDGGVSALRKDCDEATFAATIAAMLQPSEA
jgi:glycosyltransferase involved in cell wall biosynthesis